MIVRLYERGGGNSLNVSGDSWAPNPIGVLPPISALAGWGKGAGYTSGDDVLMKFLGIDPGTGLTILVKGYESDGDLIGTVTTATVASASWQQASDDGVIPASCTELRVECSGRGASALVDHIDVLVAPTITDLFHTFSNLLCDDLTGWTQDSGSWALTSPKLAGSWSIGCLTAGQLRQQQNITASGGDVLFLSAWFRYNHVDDEISLTAEIRDSADSVIGSEVLAAQQDFRSPTITSTWIRRETFYTLPTGVAKLRLRVEGALGSGSSGPQIDAIQAVLLRP